jgi:hypothetical protein
VKQIQRGSITTEPVACAVEEIKNTHKNRLFERAVNLPRFRIDLVTVEPAGGRRRLHTLAAEPVRSPKGMYNTKGLEHLIGKEGRERCLGIGPLLGDRKSVV